MPQIWRMLRNAAHRYGQRVIRITPPTQGSLTGRTGQRDPLSRTETQVTPQGELEAELSYAPVLPEENENPDKVTIRPMPRRHWLARLVRAIARTWRDRDMILARMIERPVNLALRAWHLRPWRQLTPEEKYLAEEQERRKKQANALMQEANLYWDRLQNALDRYGYQHKSNGKDGEIRITRHVGFDTVKMSPDAIYYRIDTAKLPFGTRITELVADRDLLSDLSITCGRRVKSYYTEQAGAWYIVERAVGVGGIPDHVQFEALFEAMPASMDNLTIPMGITTNSKPVYRSLSKMYHMLVAGSIGEGKSNFLNVILCALIRRNTPEDLRIILVDLKGGLEFQFYETIPHLISVPEHAENGIANANHQVPGVLEWLHSEGEKRMDILRAAGHKDLGHYNARRKKDRLPRIVLIIDEWADIMYDPKIKNNCMELLANVAQRMRAVGIHVILCTQIPKSEVVPARIKGVLPARIAFNVPSHAASVVILDNINAHGLGATGRAILQFNQETEIQTPFINAQIVDQSVAQAISGQTDTPKARHDVTLLEILEYALEHENGYLSRDRLHAAFGKRGLTIEELSRWLAEIEGDQVVVYSSPYVVQPAAGSRGRRLVADRSSTNTVEPINPGTDA